MTHIGEIERKTQNRLVGLFKDNLKYTYLGSWIERENNRNIEEVFLHKFLKYNRQNEMRGDVKTKCDFSRAQKGKTKRDKNLTHIH